MCVVYNQPGLYKLTEIFTLSFFVIVNYSTNLFFSLFRYLIFMLSSFVGVVDFWCRRLLVSPSFWCWCFGSFSHWCLMRSSNAFGSATLG
ncbi:hypothetical protein C2G38_380682 [Gigaspora rosea]|uniref:Uncharacterized protein n=1 Tax=Gigaspora rosea TaxID=44941 RepID=A0A397UKW7_9GLOM|nr:hypothetical protein C2G38_380682 [Gigaspora rosea]